MDEPTAQDIQELTEAVNRLSELMEEHLAMMNDDGVEFEADFALDERDVH